uniref:Transferrin n=2 Tax=Hirondellea gigas TaxID=1518452 RepID=A0A2P2HVQ9_9CRUS
MKLSFSLLLTLLLTVLAVINTVTAVTICVSGHNAETACRKMKALKSHTSLSCFVTQDRYDCLLRLASKDADVAVVGAEDVYLAKQILDGKISVIGQTRSLNRRTESMRYDAVAVVRRSTISSLQDLKGSKSCHTGYRRTAGWHIPIAHLLQKKLISLSCGAGLISAEQDLMAISNFFGLACVPGHWAPDNRTNTALKSKYPNLCAMCGSPSDCSDQDQHAGYFGALECLTESNGDVAWTKHDAAVHYFNRTDKHDIKDKFGLLCPDGSVRNIEQPCPWASRPWDAWLTRTGHDNLEKITKSLKMAMEAATIGNENVSTKVQDWATQVLGIHTPSTMVSFNPPTTPYKYLSTASYFVTIERMMCPEEPVRLCVTSEPALDKCRALSQILKSRRVQPMLSCVLIRSSEGGCPSALAAGKADITTLDGAEVYKAHIEHNLVPLVSERYGLQKSSYFAVAVVRADSGINSLEDLRGKKSCHTGIGRTAGWKIPIIALLEAGLLKKGSCNYAHEIGGLFSASCVPGAKNPMYDTEGNNPESLCQLCVGTLVDGVSGPAYSVSGAEGRCDRGPSESYSGYSGAFRCLVEGGGDVAFVKHTTVGENINSAAGNISWTKGLQPQDFRLLCRGSGSADVVDFATCHLARVPAHKVVMSNQLSFNRIEEARVLLLAASSYFPPGQNNFVMFGPYHQHNDLIFKDTATELVNLPDDVFHNSLDQAYYHMLTELETCTPDPNYNPKTNNYNQAAYDTAYVADGATTVAHDMSCLLVLGCASILLLLRSS